MTVLVVPEDLRKLCRNIRADLAKQRARVTDISNVLAGPYVPARIIGNPKAWTQIYVYYRYMERWGTWSYLVSIHCADTASGVTTHTKCVSRAKDRLEDLSEDDLYDALLSTTASIKKQYKQQNT